MYLLFFLCHRNNKQGVGWCGVTTYVLVTGVSFKANL